MENKVTVDLDLFIKLVRDSEKLNILKNYINKNNYTSNEEIKELFLNNSEN